MSNSYTHYLSTLKKYPDLNFYDQATALDIHNFIDSSKIAHANYEHRAVFHHTLGLEIFLSLNPELDENFIKEVYYQHLEEDHSKIPSFADWWNTHILINSSKPFESSVELNKVLQSKFGKEKDFTELASYMTGECFNEKHLLAPYIFHNSFGCFLVEQKFGPMYEDIPTRILAENLTSYRFGKVVSLHEILSKQFASNRWMHSQVTLKHKDII